MAQPICCLHHRTEAYGKSLQRIRMIAPTLSPSMLSTALKVTCRAESDMHTVRSCIVCLLPAAAPPWAPTALFYNHPGEVG